MDADEMRTNERMYEWNREKENTEFTVSVDINFSDILISLQSALR